MQRGMSKAGPNFPLVTLARQFLLEDLAASASDDDEQLSSQSQPASASQSQSQSVSSPRLFFADTPVYSFMLPDINSTTYTEDFKAFLYHDLIDNYTLVSLEQSGLFQTPCLTHARTHAHTHTHQFNGPFYYPGEPVPER